MKLYIAYLDFYSSETCLKRNLQGPKYFYVSYMFFPPIIYSSHFTVLFLYFLSLFIFDSVIRYTIVERKKKRDKANLRNSVIFFCKTQQDAALRIY